MGPLRPFAPFSADQSKLAVILTSCHEPIKNPTLTTTAHMHVSHYLYWGCAFEPCASATSVAFLAWLEIHSPVNRFAPWFLYHRLHLAV